MQAKKCLVASPILILIFACFVCLAVCVNGGPVIYKSEVGNLEINVRRPEDGTLFAVNLYIDGVLGGTSQCCI